MDPRKSSEGRADEEASPLSSLLANREASERQAQNPSVTTWMCPESSVPDPVEIAHRVEPRPLILQPPYPAYDKLDLDGDECANFTRVARQLQDTHLMARAEDCREPDLVVDSQLGTSTSLNTGLEMGIPGGSVDFDNSQLPTQQVQPAVGGSSNRLGPFQYHHPGQLPGVGEMNLEGGANVSSLGMGLPSMSGPSLNLEPSFEQGGALHGFGNLLPDIRGETVDLTWEDVGPLLSGGHGKPASKPTLGVTKPQRLSRRIPDTWQRMDFRGSGSRRSLDISADDAMGARLHEPLNSAGLSREMLLEQLLEQVTGASEEKTEDPDMKKRND